MADGEVKIPDPAGKTITLERHEGRFYPQFLHLHDNLRNLAKTKMRDDDVVLLAYPSSGTHWVWEITNQLLNGKAESYKGVKLEVFLEMAAPSNVDKIASPRVLNTHVQPDLFAHEQLLNRKLIFMTRNPKDVLVSKFHHAHNFPPSFSYDGDLKGYFELSMNGTVDYGTWTDYTLAWDDYFTNNKLDVLYVFFEDLKEDLESGVRKIANHLGIDASDTLINDVAKMCTFKQMKSDKSASYPDERKKLWRDGEYRIYRKGEVGDWKNHFTVAMDTTFNKIYTEAMSRSGILKNIRFTI